MNKLYVCKDISFKYPDGTDALININLEIGRNTATAIVGATGSGKSTLLMLLGNLLRPTRGEIYYKGVLLDRYEDFRREVGVLMQNPLNQFLSSTIYDEIAYVPRQLGWDRGRVDEAVNNVADKLDLTHLLDKSPFKVSGGEARRVGLAMVLSYSPETLLLDEPFQDLSENHINKVRKILRGLIGEGKTIIYTSNSLDHVVGVANNVIIIDGGRIVWWGDLNSVIHNVDMLIDIGVGYPQFLKIYYALGLSRDHPVPSSPDELVEILRDLIHK